MQENKLLFEKNLLVYDTLNASNDSEFVFLRVNFCGRVVDYKSVVKESEIIIYIAGDISEIYNSIQDKCSGCRLYAVHPFSHNMVAVVEAVNYGFVPINIYDLGIYFMNIFPNFFERICDQHKFSDLTESNKPSNAFRKGVYLSHVDQESDKYKFNLLRCSTNFQFPTENFREADHEIVNTLNDICKYFFEKPFDFNHVLAQIYENKMVENREKKARILAHSDKTKDMPLAALMAFCTFYRDLDKKGVNKSGFDYLYKGNSVLTRLIFHRKSDVSDLIEKFDLLLYPSSAFVIPLSTNRMYMHEIVPSTHNMQYLPTRMGYVVRCSKTLCIHKDGKNYIVNDQGTLVEMSDMTQQDFQELKRLYYHENTSAQVVDYPFFNSSMNHGDYLPPIY
jgi:hypothetical protein